MPELREIANPPQSCPEGQLSEVAQRLDRLNRSLDSLEETTATLIGRLRVILTPRLEDPGDAEKDCVSENCSYVSSAVSAQARRVDFLAKTLHEVISRLEV